MPILIQALALVGEPGSLFFHLFLLFILGWAALATTINAWQRREAEASRLAVLVWSLFLLRLLNFSVFMLGAAGKLDPLISIPPVSRALAALTTVIFILLLAFPEPSGVADFVAIGFTFLTPVFVGLAWTYWAAEVNAGATFYNGSAQETAWEIGQLIFLFAGLVLVGVRRRAEWPLGIGLMTVLFIGHIIHYLFPLAGTNVPGAVRLAEIVAYPLFAVIIYFRARPPALEVEAELPPSRHTFVEPPAAKGDWIAQKLEESQPLSPVILPPVAPPPATSVEKPRPQRVEATPPMSAPVAEIQVGPSPLSETPALTPATVETPLTGIFATANVVHPASPELGWTLSLATNICPRLGLEYDSHSRHGFASNLNACFAANGAEIALDYQNAYCLTDAHGRCAIYTGQIKSPKVPIGDPQGGRFPRGEGLRWGRMALTLIIILIVLVGATLAGLVIFRNQVAHVAPGLVTFVPAFPLRTVTATPRPGPTALPPQIVAIKVTAGQTLTATLYLPATGQPAPTILLLPDAARAPEDWTPFARSLQTAGYAALALNWPGPPQSPQQLTDAAKAAWAYLAADTRVNVARVTLIGAGVGTNVALTVAAQITQAQSLVLLSPAANFSDSAGEAGLMTAYGKRPVLLVVGADDTASASRALKLDGLALGDHKLLIRAGGGSGAKLMGQADLIDAIVQWLNQHR